MISNAIGSVIHARAATALGGSETPEYEVPWWTWALVLVNLVVFLPVMLWQSYTVEKVWPVFAMVEDESPPPYEPVALDEPAAASAEEPVFTGETSAISSSARSIQRNIHANGGVSANFRGFFCYLAQLLAYLFIVIFFFPIGSAYSSFATLIVPLALVQLSTAWVHIVITRKSTLHFWSRLPPFASTFNATWKAVMIHWAATELCRWVPMVMMTLMGVRGPSLNKSDQISVDPDMAWALPVSIVVTLIPFIFVVIPAQVVLVRVQASLLPADAETVIAFDRSFGGLVEPVIATGKGYATVSQAWATFSRAAWKRLVILYAKIFVIGIIISGLMTAVIIPQVILVLSFSKKIN
jgi:hypothetical protein